MTKCFKCKKPIGRIETRVKVWNKGLTKQMVNFVSFHINCYNEYVKKDN